jgi:hypothetical protein
LATMLVRPATETFCPPPRFARAAICRTCSRISCLSALLETHCHPPYDGPTILPWLIGNSRADRRAPARHSHSLDLDPIGVRREPSLRTWHRLALSVPLLLDRPHQLAENTRLVCVPRHRLLAAFRVS